MTEIKFFLILLFFINANISYAIPNLDKSQDKLFNSIMNQTLTKFQVKNYFDEASGKNLQYNLFLPDDYDESNKYPVIFFIADGSSVGKDADFSLKQGYGGIIWASDYEQSKHKCIVIVPVYSGVILDDHRGFTVSDYIDVTKNFIDFAIKNYSIDTKKIYATGQSMGCMTFLYLASKYPDLFTAELFVSGQWDINELKGIESQKFFYVTAAGDDKASTGQSEVIKMFENDNIEFKYFNDVNALKPDLNVNVREFSNKNFVRFKLGSVLPESLSIGTPEHMFSFDFAYKIEAVRDWLFNQSK